MDTKMPYKGQKLTYRAIGGFEYPAEITDIGPKGVSVTITGPSGWTLNLTRIRYLNEWYRTDGDGVCYPPRAAEQDDAAA